jgi:hypothetical protein
MPPNSRLKVVRRAASADRGKGILKHFKQVSREEYLEKCRLETAELRAKLEEQEQFDKAMHQQRKRTAARERKRLQREHQKQLKEVCWQRTLAKGNV